MTAQVARDDIVRRVDEWLQPGRFQDYCPNGLQVEGKSRVRRIVSGVTASQAFIDAALAADADMILVHHGYFWKGEDQRIQGMKKQRLQSLLARDVSLLAYHLPLDAHAELGNNRQLANRLGIKHAKPLDPEGGLVWMGDLEAAMSAEDFAGLLEDRLARRPLHVGEGRAGIRKVAWCTGAAQGFITHALEAGADAYVSGEISEPTVHTARECGIHYFSAGHHATERYGVQAVGERLARELDIEHQFIDIDNPV
ncbi:Nif3-like dinuclear metal center hexameric protein [Marinobacter nanhaiticus D15-8W]|uniref:GTP cyclohydrolase 1 type 2 homolog n=1 Tax=Marinobacter nanhaiticus D15-8W TaxID=626887 RepID=N6WQP7_9GAMM|nr:Nif3-like dinuclear metal center hexameric protein [Marinobacter nanhaiticus]ENO13382.1 Nif3-like dinuclear metal center hexameric protein [Marinobacter nanhaiticus D15-8W]BES70749.1 Nif3-like dinuclear metal center hexameric protein [Marinobacter nanhaiticus D15-8W]